MAQKGWNFVACFLPIYSPSWDLESFDNPKIKIMKNLIGAWEIQEMETWDEDYFNMEIQAYKYLSLNNR